MDIRHISIMETCRISIMESGSLNYKLECLLCHIVLPVMYVIDWLACYEHEKVR